MSAVIPNARRRSRCVAVLLLAAAAMGAVGCRTGRTVTVDFLWVVTDPAPAQGVSRAIVRLEKERKERIRVALIEDRALAAGNVWRASVWMAAFQAAMAARQDLADWLVSVEIDTQGQGIEGPSAGALLTAAIMAGMTGVSVRADFTMTGTVNPDGTVGAVAGVPNKFKAALAAGKRRLGYPVGLRHDVDVETGKVVDLHSFLTRGAEAVIPIRSVYDAYAHLTGRSIPRPAACRPDEMALPDAVTGALRRASLAWLEHAAKARTTYDALALKASGLGPQWDFVRGEVTAARTALAAGRMAPAYWRAANVVVTASVALAMGQVLAAVQRADFAAARDVLRGVLRSTEAEVTGVMARLRTTPARDSSDLMTLVDAHEAAISAMRSYATYRRRLHGAVQSFEETVREVARGEVRAQDVQAGELFRAATEPLYEMILARTNAGVAGQNLGFRAPDRLGLPVDLRRVDSVNTVLDAAARANLAYFEAATAERANARLDATYLSSQVIPKVVSGPVQEALGGREQAAVARLAGAMSVYIKASMLVSKHDAFDMRFDAQGALVTVGRTAAFETTLALAEEMARENAAAARYVTGRIPVPSRIAYQIAQDYRGRGTPADRVEALEQYWRSSMFSRLVVMLHAQ